MYNNARNLFEHNPIDKTFPQVKTEISEIKINKIGDDQIRLISVNHSI